MKPNIAHAIELLIQCAEKYGSTAERVAAAEMEVYLATYSPEEKEV